MIDDLVEALHYCINYRYCIEISGDLCSLHDCYYSFYFCLAFMVVVFSMLLEIVIFGLMCMMLERQTTIIVDAETVRQLL